MGTPRGGFAVLLAAAALAAAPPASDIQPALAALLRHDFQFSAADLGDLERGKAVKRALPAGAPGDVGVAGAIRIRARKEALVDAYRDIARFKQGPDVPQIGRFSASPVVTDLERLTIEKEDVDLRTCRVGRCDIRLPADAIRRVQQEIDWKARDADARAAALFKQMLVDHVRSYVAGGPGRITAYEDERQPIHPEEEFAGLLGEATYLEDILPGLRGHWQAFPATRLQDAEEFLYWSKEKFGLGPFITVTHVTMAPAGAGEYVIASRDVYSSRYFDASLTVSVASDAVGDPTAFYLVYVNRSRADALKGAFASLRRSLVERRVRSGVEEQLLAVKRRLESGSR